MSVVFDEMDELLRNLERRSESENRWLWDLRARLLDEVKQIEQRITALTGIEDFTR